MSTANAIKVAVTVTGDGTTRVAKYELREGLTTDPAEILARIKNALPEFDTVDRHQDYL